MKRYMLDTNTVSYSFKRNPAVIQHLQEAPIASVCISSITEGELYFGLAKRPQARRLRTAVENFLRHVDVLSWDSAAARTYGSIRAALEKSGNTLAPLDMLIAAHARVAEAILVTNDRAFGRVPQLKVEDWTTV